MAQYLVATPPKRKQLNGMDERWCWVVACHRLPRGSLTVFSPVLPKQLAKFKKRRTMKYICLGYIKPGTLEGMTEDERHAVLDECFAHNDHLRANGHAVAELALQPPETALTLYWKNGKVATTDGPRKLRNSSAAFPSLKLETSITPFSWSQSFQALSMDLD